MRLTINLLGWTLDLGVEPTPQDTEDESSEPVIQAYGSVCSESVIVDDGSLYGSEERWEEDKKKQINIQR